MEKHSNPCTPHSLPQSCPLTEQVEALRTPQRRTVLKIGLGAVAAAFLWPRRVWAKKLAIGLDKAPQLKTVGGFVILQVKDREILFIRDTEETIRAVDPVCTHQKTRIKWDPKLKLIRCPKHGSRYTLDGKVVKGPSKKPLAVIYAATLDKAKNRVIVEI